jgi:P27 family predicted phage terminase small subunit
MGRRARPVELLKNKGSHASKKQLRQRESAEAKLKAPADAVDPPTWLSLDARRVWERIVPELLKLELATNINVDTLAIWCDAVAKCALCATKVDEQGPVVRSRGGNVQNPYALMQVKYAGIIRQYSGEFGMTPASIAKLAIPTGEGEQKDAYATQFG